jgi:hypothetical protein
MKTITKVVCAAAAVALLGTNAAFADDPRLQHLTEILRAEMERNQQPASIAVYANDRGLGRTDATMSEERGEARFELRSNPHGQTFGAYVPAK